MSAVATDLSPYNRMPNVDPTFAAQVRKDFARRWAAMIHKSTGLKGAQRETVRKPATILPKATLQKTVLKMASRAELLNPHGRGAELKESFEKMAHDLERKEYGEKLHTLRLAARGDDEDARNAKAKLAAISTKTFSNFFTTGSNWSGFYGMNTLEHDERPYLINKTPQEIGVVTIGQDGVPRRNQAVLHRAEVPVPLFFLQTDDYEYPVFDLYRGHDVRDIAVQNVDMERDMGAQINILMQRGILIGLATSRITLAWSNSGALAGRAYVAHSHINENNFPAGNFIYLTGSAAVNGGAANSLMRKEVLDKIMQYTASWGDAFDGQNLGITKIIVPAKHYAHMAQGLAVDSRSNKLVDQIFEGGHIIDYLGQKFAYVGDNTLDATSGVAYVQFNQPMGEWYNKPAGDADFLDNSLAMQKQNKEAVSMRKAVGVAYPSTGAPRVLAVQYAGVTALLT